MSTIFIQNRWPNYLVAQVCLCHWVCVSGSVCASMVKAECSAAADLEEGSEALSHEGH